MKHPNIFWILIDSARNSRTDADDRGLPESVEKFAEEGIFFKNVVCSAPSTMMSVTSMMTSHPSYLLARNYDNFPEIQKQFRTLPGVLRKNNYKTYGVVYYKHGRETIGDMVGNLSRKHIPNGLSHRKQFWTNKDVFDVFNKMINKEYDQPLFCYLHYNVRLDNSISELFLKTIDLIKQKGYYDNSIIIVNSDHGYPLPWRGWSQNNVKTHNIGHDLLLNNDNILTPLIIKYPYCQKSVVVEDYFSSIDVSPTILKLAGIDKDDTFKGESVFLDSNNIRKSNELLRCDNRFLGQPLKGTAIIKDHFKIISHTLPNSSQIFEFYDLKNDPEERDNIASSEHFTIQFEQYKKILSKSENEFLKFHKDFLLVKWGSSLKKLLTNQLSIKKVGILCQDTEQYQSLMRDVCSTLFPEASIIINPETRLNLELIIISISTELPWKIKANKKELMKFKYKSVLWFDNNGIIYKKSPVLALTLKYVKRRLMFIYWDPFLIFEFIKRLIIRKGLNDSESKTLQSLVDSES